ncbi:hypothetical protein MAFF212519_28220 [Clavibacter michiganensis]
MTDDRTPDPDAPHALEQHGREPDDRRGELIAAALADDLSPAETAELDAMRAATRRSTRRSRCSAGCRRLSVGSARGRRRSRATSSRAGSA